MQRILITGCKGGIGLHAAMNLAKKGNFVYATVHKEKSIDELKTKLAPYSQNTFVGKLDIRDPEDRKKILDWDLDVLVNNAGIGDSGPLIEMDTELIQNVFETNVLSTIKLTQLAVRKMIADEKKGRVVIVGSMYGHLPTPFLTPYGISKFALENVAYSLRMELKPFGIPVVMVNPGAYNTGFNKKNIDKKYRWMDKNGLYKDHMDIIKKSEDQLIGLEVQDIKSIVNKLVKAVTDKKPRKRYKAPYWQWMLIPVGKSLS